MSLLTFLAEFLRNLNQQRLRTFLTVFGIMWGTATLLILLAFGVGFRNQTTLNMRGIGDEIVIVFNGRTSKTFEGYNIGRRVQMRESDAQLVLSQIDGIKEIAPEYSRWNTTVRYGERRNNPNLSGVVPHYGSMRNIFAEAGGRWFNDQDQAQRRRVAFLGNALAQLLFQGEDPIGKTIQIGPNPFTVIGVMAPKTQNSSYSARDEDRVFIPASTYSVMYGTDAINNLIYTVKNPTEADQVKAQFYEVMGRKHRFDPTDTDALGIWDTNEFWKFMYFFFIGFNGFLGLIGFFTLAVGGIGVANIMFVVVQERMKEIGIRRSVGARRSHILFQFLTETFLIVGIGAGMGYLIGWGITSGMAALPIKDFVGVPVMSPMVGLAAGVVLTLISLAAGLLPAVRASRLDIVECLRV